jgi:ATP-dependent DNA helicase RecG
MITLDTLNHWLIAPAEHEHLEFKEAKQTFDTTKLLRYCAALANEGGGNLVLGVADKSPRKVIGSAAFTSTADLNQMKEAILQKFRFRVETTELHHPSGRVLVFTIPPRPLGQPIEFDGAYLMRSGESLTSMTPDKLKRIFAEGVGDWSAQVVVGATHADLDAQALALARVKFSEKHKQDTFYADIADWDNATFLDRAKITINGNITHTALLLLGKSESSHLLPTLPQITWKLVGDEQAYEHFGMPFLTTTTQVLHRIRNINYKFFPQNELLATEVKKYDPRVILEALHNCIAHQDYSLRARVLITEYVDRLVFENAGSFYDGRPEDYFTGEQTPTRYRNPWLSHAMVELSMIDTVGLGIRTMFVSQRNRYFPLPDYSKSSIDKVVLEIYGHMIDENYTQLLMAKNDLPLTTVILLDRVQKKQLITDEAAAMLRKAGLIEGRKPNFYTAGVIAQTTNNKTEYIRNRAFADDHYKKMILDYLKQYGAATRQELNSLILDKLSDVLDEQQKLNKVRNLLHTMSKREQTIEKSGGAQKGSWVLAKTVKAEI